MRRGLLKISHSIIGRFFFLAVFLFLLPVNMLTSQEIRSQITVSIDSAAERSIDDMKEMDTMLRDMGLPVINKDMPFRHGMGQRTYRGIKEAATRAAGPNPHRPDAAKTLEPLSPPALVGSIAGVNQTEAGGWRPPDTHGAIGHKTGVGYVEVTNSHIDIYRMSNGVRLQSLSLASFFGYTAESIFDPRCIYDHIWHRWIVTAEAFPESSTVQRQLIAVSSTDNPLSSWYIYSIDVNTNDNDDFWDYPQVGYDQDAVIITANVFGPSFFRDARIFAVAKARLYNGLSIRTKLFAGLPITMAPPIVLDDNPNAYILEAPQGGNTIRKYTLRHGSRPDATTLTASTILVPSYSLPPDARQPGTASTLDTLDARFCNNSIQNGDSIWNVHCINVGGLPTPKWYEFDTQGVGADTVKASGTFSASGTSNDWMPHIVANATGDIFAVWSSTDPSAGLHAQVRVSGKRAADPNIPAGVVAYQSTTFYTQSRWGDYQSVSLDPTNPNAAYFVGETIINSTTWGTRIGKLEF